MKNQILLGKPASSSRPFHSFIIYLLKCHRIGNPRGHFLNVFPILSLKGTDVTWISKYWHISAQIVITDYVLGVMGSAWHWLWPVLGEHRGAKSKDTNLHPAQQFLVKVVIRTHSLKWTNRFLNFCHKLLRAIRCPTFPFIAYWVNEKVFKYMETHISFLSGPLL